MSLMSYSIRGALPGDVPMIHSMIQELAVFERLEHLLVATEEDLHEALFEHDGGAHGLVAELSAEPGRDPTLVGYAIYFENFSTFLCRRGLYLEDIYVRPDYRKQGIGKAFLRHLAAIALERKHGRMEWVVLDWNQNAIDVYKAIGGEILDEWRVVRLTHDAITKLADE